MVPSDASRMPSTPRSFPCRATRRRLCARSVSMQISCVPRRRAGCRPQSSGRCRPPLAWHWRHRRPRRSRRRASWRCRSRTQCRRVTAGPGGRHATGLRSPGSVRSQSFPVDSDPRRGRPGSGSPVQSFRRASPTGRGSLASMFAVQRGQRQDAREVLVLGEILTRAAVVHDCVFVARACAFRHRNRAAGTSRSS